MLENDKIIASSEIIDHIISVTFRPDRMKEKRTEYKLFRKKFNRPLALRQNHRHPRAHADLAGDVDLTT